MIDGAFDRRLKLDMTSLSWMGYKRKELEMFPSLFAWAQLQAWVSTLERTLGAALKFPQSGQVTHLETQWT